MTLGHVYDMDLKKNETLIKEVIIQAQGEVSLVPWSNINVSQLYRWRWKSISSKLRKPGPVIL
jgi:hypothetical protein